MKINCEVNRTVEGSLCPKYDARRLMKKKTNNDMKSNTVYHLTPYDQSSADDGSRADVGELWICPLVDCHVPGQAFLWGDRCFCYERRPFCNLQTTF